jgi:hypothetical protein
MPDVRFRELQPREFSQSYSGGLTATRTFTVTCAEGTSAEEILNAIGISDGSRHPEYSGLLNSGRSISRNGDDSVTASYTYDTIDKAEENPIAQPAQWSFSTGGASVPSLAYFFGGGNGDVRPLTNAVGEYVWENITHTIAEVRVNISRNTLTRPDDILGMTNMVNSGSYLWGGAYTWLCAGVSCSRESQKVGTQIQKYWRTSVELVYRESGYYYNLPHVGWGYFKAGAGGYQRFQIRKGDELVDSPTPMPLNEIGGPKYAIGENGAPDYIFRRVHAAADFSIFGSPPP